MGDCIQILKDNLMAISDSSQREELQEIFAKEIEIPVSGCYDVDSDEDNDYYLIDDYITDETKKELGLI